MRDESMRRQQAALVALATSSAAKDGRMAELAPLATESVAALVAVARVSVWLLDAARTRLELLDLFEATARTHARDAVLEASEHPVYFVALHESRAVAAHDAWTDPRTCEFRDAYLRPLGIRSMLDATIRIAGEVVGVLCLEHVGELRHWTDDEIAFAAEVADQLAHALLNRARAEEAAQRERLQEQLVRAQRFEALGRLAGGIAHDFNNLLTVIVGHASLLLGEAGTHQDVLEILGAAERGGELTQQLLAFSRQQTLELHAIELGATLEAIERMLARLVGEDVELHLALASEPLLVRATEGLIQQIVANLVVNARDAMPAGGRIEVTLAGEQLTSSAPTLEPLPPGPYAVLRVRDTGSGIPPELREQVFEPFFTTKEPGKGTGLGLSTVYGIAQRCAGSIALHSEVGVGTELAVYLPRLDPQRVESDSRPALPEFPPPFGRGRVLVVVEDNAAVRRLVARALEQVGFVVHGLADAPAAIALLDVLPEPPSLVLSDVVMPAGGSLPLLAWLREHRPTLPIALMSGYVAPTSAAELASLPMLAKPFTTTHLYEHVRSVIGA
jgi:signal transduction histidine kinase